MAGKHEKQRRVEIVKGVKKGRKGTVVETVSDKYGDRYRLRTDENTIIASVPVENVKEI